MTLRRSLLPATLALVLAACGGTPNASPSRPGGANPSGGTAAGTDRASLPPGAVPTTSVPATIDSCTLLSDDEVKLATGEGVAERKASTLTQVFSSVCNLALDGGGSLTLSILPSTGKKLWDVSFGPFVGTDVLEVEVPGLGDAAGGSRSGDGVMVLKDDVLFDVQFIEFGRPEKGPAVRYLAEIILAKLPCLSSGCPGFTPPPAPSAAAAIDACALLTADEIKAATHLAAKTAEPGPSECTWPLETTSGFGLESIQLTVLASGGRARFDIFSSGMEHLAGVGDDAVVLGGNTAGSIQAVSGDRLVTLKYALPVDTPDANPLVVPLLKSAISRLPG
jgi:hypothetical protein